MARLVVAVVAAAGSLYWLASSTDLRDAWTLAQRTDLLPLAAAVALLVASLTAKALRWRALLPARALTPVEAFRVFHVSILLNNVLPLRVGDGARVLAPAVRRHVPPRQALVVLVVERAMDAVFLLTVALFVLPLGGGGGVVRGLDKVTGGRGLAVLALALVAGVLAATIVLSRAGIRQHLGAALRRIQGDLRATVRGRLRVPRILGWTFTAWAGTFVLHYLLFGAVGIHGSLELAVVVTLATNFAMLVPATPASVGVFHLAAAAPLLAAGMPRDASVAYALVAHAVNIVPAIAVGVLCLALPAVLPLARAPARALAGGHAARWRR